jgi:hypothetical protein
MVFGSYDGFASSFDAGWSFVEGRERVGDAFYWRNAVNGGINSLYCYLRVNRIACSYSELVRQQAELLQDRPQSVALLAQLAARKGVQLTPVKVMSQGLSSCPLPIVVHVEARRRIQVSLLSSRG